MNHNPLEEDAGSYAVIQMYNAVQCGGSRLLYELIESDVLYEEEAAGH